jgi:hypothetical protein
VTSVTKGRTQKFPQRFLALSEDTISFSIQPFLGEKKCIFTIFLKKTQVLKLIYKHLVPNTYQGYRCHYDSSTRYEESERMET